MISKLIIEQIINLITIIIKELKKDDYEKIMNP